MGMAASQARYLALVARKSNCEYEGQQINQARLNLSNQSANLFNQMLGLSVPVPPSTQDFTKTQYSFTDGVNNAVIDNWYQLAEADSDGYNYIVNYHYNANVYTGSQKKMNDPQVQFTWDIPSSSSWSANIAEIQAKLVEIATKQDAVDKAEETLANLQKQAARQSTYADKDTYGSNSISYATYTSDNGTYTLTLSGNNSSTTTTFKSYDKLTDEEKTTVDGYINDWKSLGWEIDTDSTYWEYNNDSLLSPAIFAFSDDLKALKQQDSSTQAISDGKTSLTIYHYSQDQQVKPADAESYVSMNSKIATAKTALKSAKDELSLAKDEYEALSVPSYIGNNQLTPLYELTNSQVSEIKQVIKDMESQDVSTTLTQCFNTGTYTNNDYLGGIYTFVQNGVTYYATYYDLAETASEGTGINHIDDQPQLPYYNASYVSTRIEKQEKAVLETDSSGRFVSVRLGNDTIKYVLNVETITDDAAYEDAMNQYYYDNAQYDKMVQDINAKTSIIQVEDRTLELRLKQLDTEQNALSNEIEAVSKVVKDNVEKSFKTFGG